MFGLDRETAIITAVVICVVASAYIYRELKKSQEEIAQVKSFIEREVEESQAYMNAAAAAQMMAPPLDQPTTTKKVKIIDEETEQRTINSSEKIQPQ